MGTLDPQVRVGGKGKEEGFKKAFDGAEGKKFPAETTATRAAREGKGNETTDMALFVRTSSETLSDWNRQRIVEALLRETTIDPDMAERISREVEEQIINSKISLVTAPLVRELVDAKLIEYGLEEARKMHTRLGVPLYDVK